MNFFITGSDTGVGKTYITALLLRSLRNQNKDAVGMKPIETGGNQDAIQLHQAMGGRISLETVNPISLSHALAPAVAAEREGRTISLEKIFANYRQLAGKHSFVLVEGAGGWRVPIAPNYEMADLAVDLSKISPLQVVVVALNRLGVINHTLLTVESICARGLVCAGLLLNQGASVSSDASTTSNAQWLMRSSLVPFLGEVRAGQSTFPESLLGHLTGIRIPTKTSIQPVAP